MMKTALQMKALIYPLFALMLVLGLMVPLGTPASACYYPDLKVKADGCGHVYAHACGHADTDAHADTPSIRDRGDGGRRDGRD